MLIKSMKTVMWWFVEAIAFVLYGIRKVWRVSRTPYRLVEKKYMIVKIITTIVKLVLLAYIIMIAASFIVGMVIGLILIRSFFTSAEAGLRNNF